MSERCVAIERWWCGGEVERLRTVGSCDPYEKNEKGAKWKLRGSITSQPAD